MSAILYEWQRRKGDNWSSIIAVKVFRWNISVWEKWVNKIEIDRLSVRPLAQAGESSQERLSVLNPGPVDEEDSGLKVGYWSYPAASLTCSRPGWYVGYQARPGHASPVTFGSNTKSSSPSTLFLANQNALLDSWAFWTIIMQPCGRSSKQRRSR